MKQDSGHITRKVIMGYILLIAIAICSIVYIYHVIVRIAGEDEPDTTSRRKVYLITGTLTLLYESETIDQLIGIRQSGYTKYNNILNKAQHNIDSLRVLVTDSVQLLKIDTIGNLIERKRRNTRRLLETMKEANAEHLYRANIEKIIAIQDTIIEPKKVEEHVIIQQDTVVVKKKPKGFFKRLAEVFSPSQPDSNIVVNTIQHIQQDTLIEVYNPADTIVTILKSIQDSVADQKKELNKLLLLRANNLRYDNSIITQKINQMLRDIEQEDMNSSFNRVQHKQKLMRQTSRLIAIIAIISVFIAVVFLIFIGRDISRSQYYRKQLEKAKQYAEDLLHIREKLMLTISHDIRAPLSSIIGYIELLQHFGMNERQRYYLKNMTGSAEHILALVNDLLDFYRLESKQMEIHPVPFSIPVLFKEIYDSFQPLAKNKGLHFILDLGNTEQDKRQYMGDTLRIRQIASNLLSNAIKFTFEGQIVFSVSLSEKSETSGKLVFQVIDAGPGIPLAEQDKIFGEFTRLSSAEKEEGFGLGLSITRKLIELMGGVLSLKSTPGKGSTFVVELMLSTMVSNNISFLEENERKKEEHGFRLSEEILSSSETSDTPVYPVKDIHCLLIDDDPLQLAMTRELLTYSHIKVTCCLQPQEVMNILMREHVDLVITDIQMPGCDGFSLLKRIRESSLPNAETLPVVALSASLTNEKEHYLLAGFAGFLNKPFTGVQLLSLINELLLLPQQEIPCNLDFSSLTAFADGDAEASANILRTFCEETRKNILLLYESSVVADREKAGRVAHKLIPLFTILGTSDLIGQLRKLEENNPNMSLEEWSIILMKVTAQVLHIVKDVERNL